MAYVFLLHFAQPVNPDYPARHYLEYAENIAARLRDHRSGDRTRTSGIMYACYERNIAFLVARIWQDATRRNEYQLRQLANNPKLCPICTPALALYTPYNAQDPSTWLSIRQQPDVTTPRYGDIETLKPYTYKPRHRTRSNGESNRTSGIQSTWRQATKAAININTIDVAIAPGSISVLGVQLYRQVDPPIDIDHAPTGFDDDLPY